MSSFSKSSTDSPSYKPWVEQIQSFLNDDFNDDNLVPVSIFKIPKAIAIFKPKAYAPQLIALGPYHHWRDDLYEMEMYKLLCAKRVQAQSQPMFKFQHLIQKLMKIEYRIRSCYQKYLSIDAETLALMMAIDGLFLLEFLFHTYVNNQCTGALASSARMSHLNVGKTIAYGEILKDMVMLENQIPIFVLKKILRFRCSSGEAVAADNLLPSMLLGVCKELSPLKLVDDYPFSRVMEHAHLLDLLYHLILPKAEESLNLQNQQDDYQIKIEAEGEENGADEIGEGVETLTKTWNLLSELNLGVVRSLKKFIDCNKPIGLIITLPRQAVSKVPIVSAIAPILEQLLPSDNEEKSQHNKKDDDEYESKAPLVEEIMIPSVTDLCDAGITFCPAEGNNISAIKFDARKKRFYLPVVQLDRNTEVVMRNLVAYEASAVSGRLVLGRFVELMNGIIDTAEDAKLLREKNIIINRLKSDKEVADFWNGMNRSINLTNVPFIDKAIHDANVYYNNTRKVKLYKMMKVYVYGSWKVLIFLAAVLYLALMILQSFCSVYSCRHLFSTDQDHEH